MLKITNSLRFSTFTFLRREKMLRNLFFLLLLLSFNLSQLYTSDTLYPRYKNFLANPTALKALKNYQIVGIIVDEKNDSLEFVIHRILPDTIRLQIRFGTQYAITVITGETGWIVDPTQGIIQPRELHPEEISRMSSNILSLFSFFDPNIFDNVKSTDLTSPDTSYISFLIINSHSDTTTYFFNKVNFSDIFKVVKFYLSPHTFKIIPKFFFNFKGFSIPRVIEVIANNSRKTTLSIVNININTSIDSNLFNFKK